jgi:hypothetical protein
MRVALGVASAAALALACGCAGPSTFVSPDPPAPAQVDASFPNDPAAVHLALSRAMELAGISIVPGESTATVAVAEKHQLPYIAEEAGAPAAGRLPVYRMRALLSRRGVETHVRIVVEPLCPACDGTTPYEWEYPIDLIRSVLERTRSSLGHRGPRIQYPPRFVPRRWRP